MCRFLIVKSKNKIKTQELLNLFADMCEKSKAPDSTLQEDGWGVAWLQGDKWETYKSLLPIWLDRKNFNKIPDTKIFVAHARSATFEKEKGIIDYNQPFIDGKYCFVFNGSVKGANFKQKIPGNIGAQKIWFLVKKYLKNYSLFDTLTITKNLIEKNSEKIIALNIGVITRDTSAALCSYTQNKKYYNLYTSKKNSISLICSEPLDSFSWQSIKNGETVFHS